MTNQTIVIPEEVENILDELTEKYESIYGKVNITVYSVADVGKFILFSIDGDPLCSITLIGKDVWTSYYEPETMIQ